MQTSTYSPQTENPDSFPRDLNSRTLRQHLDVQGTLSEAVAVQVFSGLLELLGNRHDLSTLSLLTPEQIFLSETGQVSVKSVASIQPPLLRSFYTAPEAATQSLLGGSAIIYNLAILLYEMLVGTPPFVGETAVATLLLHRYEPLPSLPTTIHPALRSLLHRALQKNPAHRFLSFEEMRDSLPVLQISPSEQKGLAQKERREVRVRSRQSMGAGIIRVISRTFSVTLKVALVIGLLGITGGSIVWVATPRNPKVETSVRPFADIPQPKIKDEQPDNKQIGKEKGGAEQASAVAPPRSPIDKPKPTLTPVTRNKLPRRNLPKPNNTKPNQVKDAAPVFAKPVISDPIEKGEPKPTENVALKPSESGTPGPSAAKTEVAQ